MNQVNTRFGWRTWVLLLLFGGLTFFVYSRFADLRSIGHALSQGIWEWVLVGIGLHVVFFLMQAELYKLSFDTVEVKTTALQLLPVVFGSLLLNALIPSGGAAGGAVYVANAVCHGQSGARAAVGALLAVLADLASLIPYIAFAILFLGSQHQLYVYDSVAVGFFLLFITILSVAILLAGWKPKWLCKALGVVQRIINHVGGWFKHPNLVGETWADTTSQELDEAAHAISTHPDRLARAVGWAFVMHAVNLIGLYVFFVAFRQPAKFGTLVAGFSMGIVFWVVAIIPQGIAVVEGIMSLVFQSLGVPGEKIVAIVFAFRGVNFYLPLIIGFFSLRYIGRLLSATAAVRRGEAATCDLSPERKDG